jgi:pimeloyl-ACP methyl ester carboxylesterase
MPRPPRDTATYIEVSGQTLHGRRLRDEFDGPPLVFLHEGLGSVELWRTFPEDVVAASGHRGFVYDRCGNGWSTPLSAGRRPDYMHEEALEYLPAILELVGEEAPILIGHSDGASIALIHAGAGYEVAGLVLIAPHVFVEDETIESISALRDEFGSSDIGERMAKYHEQPETTFRGWADVWLSSSFRGWNIEDFVTGIRSPTLLIQGDEDQYGTLSQLDAIEARLVTPVERMVVAGAGHAPHLSHSRLVTDRVVDFLARLGT